MLTANTKCIFGLNAVLLNVRCKTLRVQVAETISIVPPDFFSFSPWHYKARSNGQLICGA